MEKHHFLSEPCFGYLLGNVLKLFWLLFQHLVTLVNDLQRWMAVQQQQVQPFQDSHTQTNKQESK